MCVEIENCLFIWREWDFPSIFLFSVLLFEPSLEWPDWIALDICSVQSLLLSCCGDYEPNEMRWCWQRFLLLLAWPLRLRLLWYVDERFKKKFHVNSFRLVMCEINGWQACDFPVNTSSDYGGKHCDVSEKSRVITKALSTYLKIIKKNSQLTCRDIIATKKISPAKNKLYVFQECLFTVADGDPCASGAREIMTIWNRYRRACHLSGQTWYSGGQIGKCLTNFRWFFCLNCW